MPPDEDMRGPAQTGAPAQAGGFSQLRIRPRLAQAAAELRWRTFPYLLPFRAVGAGTVVSRRATIRDPRHVGIGAGARVGPHAELWAFGPHPRGEPHAIVVAGTADIRSFALLHAYGGSIHVGRGSCVNHFCFVNGAGGVEIGDDVMIGTHSVIHSSEHGARASDIPMTRQPIVRAPVIIEGDVYIGTHVTILAGVRIGRGAVVAAGAVVNRDVPPSAIVAGVPARVLRYRDRESSQEAPER